MLAVTLSRHGREYVVTKATLAELTHLLAGLFPDPDQERPALARTSTGRGFALVSIRETPSV